MRRVPSNGEVVVAVIRQELVGRKLRERAGAAIGRVYELDRVGIGGLEDVHVGTAVAA